MNIDILHEQDDLDRATPLTIASNGNYGLGYCFVSENNILLESRVHLPIFYRYSNADLLSFLAANSYVEPNWESIEITRYAFTTIPNMDDFCATVVLKTFFLRIIQRVWKKRHQTRRRILDGSHCLYQFLRDRQIRGRRVQSLLLPTIHGMLSI